MELSLAKLVEADAIRRLKYAYLRHLDLKQWTELAELFTADVKSNYGDGKYAFTGKPALMDFLRTSLGDHRIVTQHNVHHPEITIADDLTRATATWYLEDKVIHPGSGGEGDSGFVLNGSAFYEDAYVKTNQGWKIRETGYRRVYEEIRRRDASRLLSFNTRFDSGT